MSQILGLFDSTFSFLWDVLKTPIFGFHLYNIIIGFFTISVVVRFVIMPFFGGEVFSAAKSDKVKSSDGK